MASATKFFYDSDFIGGVVSNVLSKPFWVEEGNGVREFTDKNVGDALEIFFSHTLPACGFYNILTDKGTVAIQVRDNLVREVDIKDIRAFVQYVLSRIPIGHMVIDRVVGKFEKFLSTKALATLRILDDYKPLKDKRRLGYRFYKNGAVEIKAGSDEVKLVKYKELDGFVYLSQIIDRDFDPQHLSLDPTEVLNDYSDKEGFEFLKWMQNLCRVRQDDGAWVLDSKRFRSMLSAYGYLLHQHWNDYKCVIFVDEDMESGKANGRTGKSVVLNDSLSVALNTCVIDAKTISKKGNSSSSKDFAFTFVDQSTQHICFDDACEDFAFDSLFSIITGDLTCNAKFGKMSKFGKKEKPKMSISSNHPILGDGASYTDRQHIVPVGSFYRLHKMEFNKSPDKFHGGWLFDEDDWGSKNWAEFDATCVYALRYYLDNGLIGGGYSTKYALNKLDAAVGSSDVRDALYRILTKYNGSGDALLQKTVDEMSDEDRVRSLSDYLAEQVPGEEFSPTRISSSLRLVADHYGFKINVGYPDGRKQERFGKTLKGVNAYLITDSKNPFPKKKVVEEPVVEEPINDPIDENPAPNQSLVDVGEEFDAEAAFAPLNRSL